jgi:hypothetical protein
MDGQAKEQIEEWAGRQLIGWMDGQLDKEINRQIYARTGKKTD